jgi:hypothetical protein
LDPVAVRAPLTTTLAAAVALAAAGAPAVNAQTAATPGEPNAGAGRVTLAFALDPTTGGDGHLGVQALGSEIFVSRRGVGASTLPPHSIAVFDRSGAVRRTLPQHPSTSASPWGYRDGATDGTVLMFGCELGIFVVDPATGALASAIRARNGTVALGSGAFPQNPITGPALPQVGTYRGLEFDAGGNGGAGSFWTADFGSSLFEIDLAGNVLRVVPNALPPAGWQVFGIAGDFALDGLGQRVLRSLWLSSAPDLGDLVELDPATAALTGRKIRRVRNPGSAQGGLCVVPGGLDGRASGADLLALDQASPDAVVGYRLHMWDTVRAEREAVLQHAVDGAFAAPGGPPLRLTQGSSTFAIDLRNAAPGSPYAAYFVFEPFASIRAVVPVFAELREWAIPSAFTIPTGLPFVFTRGSGSPLTLPIAPLLGFAPRGFLRCQAVYFDLAVPAPRIPVMATNEVWWSIDLAACRITVEARGESSFDADPSRGFFRVIAENPDPQKAIVGMRWDWVASTVAGQATMEFDVDQTGMADVPWGGNSAVVGCRGTYRNGSALATGLVFAGTPAPPCDPTARAGFVGSNPGSSVNDWRTLDFAFQPATFYNGRVFELDCDTDGGIGETGAAMEGMVVTLRLGDGTVCSGVLRRDPFDPLRAFVEL